MCSAGHTCDLAENGQIALDKLRENMTAPRDSANDGAIKLYDAILTDYEMPVMNGPTSVKEMRLMGYKNKIFGVTGNGLAEQVPQDTSDEIDPSVCKIPYTYPIFFSVFGCVCIKPIDCFF